jgi:hypothetical protein
LPASQACAEDRASPVFDVLRGEFADAARQHLDAVLAGRGQHVLAVQRRLDVAPAQQGGDLLLDVFGLAFFHHQHRALADAEVGHLLGHQRVGHVEHEDRDVGFAERIGQALLLQAADQRVVEPALHHDAQVGVAPTRYQFVEAVRHDVAPRGRNALVALELFVAEGDGRVREPHVIEARGLGHQRAGGDGGRNVVLALEAAAHVAGADAQLHEAGHVRGFGKAKAFFHHAHHHAQVGPRIEQAHAGLERVGMRALLDHAGAFAVVLAHHDQHAAGHAGRGEVGERIGRHVGADYRFPGDRAAQRVVDRGAEHRRGRGLVRTCLHVHAQFVHVGLALDHDVQQVRHGRALVAAHVGHARLQQALGDGEDALAVEGGASAETQHFYFLAE